MVELGYGWDTHRQSGCCKGLDVSRLKEAEDRPCANGPVSLKLTQELVDVRLPLE